MRSRTFRIGESDFLLDDEPFRVLAGALHYFRVHPDQWRDRIRAARLMGLNTIETYVPWNEHEPVPGRLDFTGRLDLARFLREVEEEGMLAIVRPGPYICAEWDGGGFPAWLFRDGGMGIRSAEPRFFAAVTAYLESVLEIVAPLQVERGGPVVLLQIENEYGAYGDFAPAERETYLRALVDVYRRCGIDVPLTTVDQPTDAMLAAGGLPELLRTGSFGSRAADRLATLRAHQPTGPLMCSEFWCGWFDHWGSFHHTGPSADSAGELEALLAAGASVNIYMFHGGTNFALTSGSNDKGVYEPTVTSYDYDAPLDEAGRPTRKFWEFREVISRHAPVPDIPDGMLQAPLEAAPEPVALAVVGALRDTLTDEGWQLFSAAPTMDAAGCFRGLVLYRAQLAGSSAPALLEIGEVRDRAHVLLDGMPVGILSRSLGQRRLRLPSGVGVLEILVEDQGRVNYGARIGEHKGLIGPVRVDGSDVADWSVQPIDLDAVAAWPASSTAPDAAASGALILRAELELDAPRDLVIDTAGFGKGIVWIDDFCLGRYWEAGPQRGLFVPAPLTRAGVNRITVLELDTAGTRELAFSGELLLGPVEY